MIEEILQYQREVVLSRRVATVAVPSGSFPLAIAGTVTETAKTVAGYAAIAGSVFSDAAGTLFVEQSLDGGSNYDLITTIPVLASTFTPFDVTVYGTTARVRYLNGAVAQTVYRVNAVARPLSGVAPGGGANGALGNVGAGLVIANTTAALGGAATFLSGIFQVGPTAVGTRYAGYDVVRAFGQSDVAGTMTAVMASASADIAAPFTNCLQVDQAVPAGGDGAQLVALISAPFVAVLYTNGAGAQARMRFFAELQ